MQAGRAEPFDFGRLSLGRRRAQAVLAPFSIAIIMVDRPERGTSARVVAMAGTEDRFARLAAGRRSPAPRRE